MKPSRSKQTSLDMQSMRLLMAIYETGSVTGASEVLDINQSSASQGLDKLRRIFGDPLFVKVGRGIAPTDRVEQIVPKVRELLSDMTSLLEAEDFDPRSDGRPFVIATNSPLRRELVQRLYSEDASKAPALQYINVGHGRNIEEILNHNKADIVIAIGKAGYSDNIRHQKLYDDTLVCYYDEAARDAPDTIEAYCSAPHIIVDFGSTDDSVVDISLKHYRKERVIAMRVPLIDSIPRLMKGTQLITTMPGQFANTIFASFAHCEPPISVPSFSVDLIWHARAENSPRNRWLRDLITSTAAQHI